MPGDVGVGMAEQGPVVRHGHAAELQGHALGLRRAEAVHVEAVAAACFQGPAREAAFGDVHVVPAGDLKVAFGAFDEADAALGESLSSVILEGPMEDLTKTENTQPALLTVAVAY